MRARPVAFAASAMVLLLCLVVTSCDAQKVTLGSCPVVSSIPITLSALVNTWIEYARTPSPHQHFLRCASYTITQVVANVRYTFVLSGVNKVNGRTIRRTGTLEVVNGVTATTTLLTGGYLGFVYGDNGLGITKSVRYSVIGTDVATAPTYLLLYSCEQFFIWKVESAILLSTTAGLTAAQIATFSNGVAAIGGSQKLLERTYTTSMCS